MMSGVSLRIDITGVPCECLLFAASPLAELTAMLHVLAGPAHHPEYQAWAASTRAELKPQLAEQLAEAEFLWRSSRADFLLPGRPRATLQEELDDVDHLDNDTYVSAALITTCGTDRTRFGMPSPLTDPASRDRALELAQARGPRQASFAERLIADPPMVRARVRRMLEDCGPAFFEENWRHVRPKIAADLRLKADLLARRGLAGTLASVSRAVSLDEDRQRIVVDKLQDNAASAAGDGVTFVPTVFGHPHLLVVHARGWRPVLQYPVTAGILPGPVPMELVRLRLEALSHPVRIRLVRTLARGSHTTGELASAFELTAPEVSRHLAVLRKAGLLTTQRRGRYVLYKLDTSTTAALGTDLIEAVLR
jgi:DNA-binding transcriptional ArsR family regulator